jgi:diguanylate cyclase
VNPDSQKPELDAFCELLIDELKSFSAAHRSLSPSSLLDALSAKADVLNALAYRANINEFRKFLIKIQDRLNPYFGPLHQERCDQQISAIKTAESLGELHRLLDELINLVSETISSSQADRNCLARLLIEVGTKLGEVETECVNLIQNSEQAQRENGRFTNLIASEISELETSTESSPDLSEVKEILRTRLANIKSALALKKAADKAGKLTFESTIQSLQNNLKEMHRQMHRAHQRTKRLEHAAFLDPLTGIPNRRHLDHLIRKEIKRHQRDKTLFSLVFIDVDNFKAVNDTYGHKVGDKCLQSLVGKMRQVLRDSDLIARYGGDEFVVLLPNTGLSAARAVADKLANAISRTCFVYKESEIQLSVSIGLTQTESGDSTPEEIIVRADAALYKAKDKGKDCIMVT